MEANDPNRCQMSIPGGQCTHEALPGSEYCSLHTRAKGDALKHYLLTNKLIGDTAARHAASDEIKSLRDEIAITRSMVEIRLNEAKTTTELVSAMPSIHSYMMALEKLVSSCHQMEVKLGILLDKSALLTAAQKIINIIDARIPRELFDGRDELIGEIAQEILEAIATQEND